MASRDEVREAQWRGILGEWRASGLSIYAFFKERQLQKATFYYWRDKLGFGMVIGIEFRSTSASNPGPR